MTKYANDHYLSLPPTVQLAERSPAPSCCEDARRYHVCPWPKHTESDVKLAALSLLVHGETADTVGTESSAMVDAEGFICLDGDEHFVCVYGEHDLLE